MRWRLPFLVLCVLVASGCNRPHYTVDLAAPNLGVFTTPDLEVYLVLRGSPADRAGILEGDVLVSLRPAMELPGLDQTPVAFGDSRSGAVYAMAEITQAVEKAGQAGFWRARPTILLTVLRDGRTLEIPATPKIFQFMRAPNWPEEPIPAEDRFF